MSICLSDSLFKFMISRHVSMCLLGVRGSSVPQEMSGRWTIFFCVGAGAGAGAGETEWYIHVMDKKS